MRQPTIIYTSLVAQTVWQHERYDHVVRDASEWQRIVPYVFDNPVKVGLIDAWENCSGVIAD